MVVGEQARLGVEVGNRGLVEDGDGGLGHGIYYAAPRVGSRHRERQADAAAMATVHEKRPRPFIYFFGGVFFSAREIEV
jgi:hypothetical protein